MPDTPSGGRQKRRKRPPRSADVVCALPSLGPPPFPPHSHHPTNTPTAAAHGTQKKKNTPSRTWRAHRFLAVPCVGHRRGKRASPIFGRAANREPKRKNNAYVFGRGPGWTAQCFAKVSLWCVYFGFSFFFSSLPPLVLCVHRLSLLFVVCCPGFVSFFVWSLMHMAIAGLAVFHSFRLPCPSISPHSWCILITLSSSLCALIEACLLIVLGSHPYCLA